MARMVGLSPRTILPACGHDFSVAAYRRLTTGGRFMTRNCKIVS